MSECVAAVEAPALQVNRYLCLDDYLHDLEWSVETDDRRMVMTYCVGKDIAMTPDHLRAVERYERENAKAVGHVLAAVRADARFRQIYVVIELPRGKEELKQYLQRMNDRVAELQIRAEQLKAELPENRKPCKSKTAVF